MRLSLLLITTCCFSAFLPLARAGELLGDLAWQESAYNGPSVEDNIKLMDTDKNGFADVYEVRAFLASKHGKDYEKDTLDRWESTSTSKSCGSSFSKSLLSQ